MRNFCLWLYNKRRTDAKAERRLDTRQNQGTVQTVSDTASPGQRPLARCRIRFLADDKVKPGADSGQYHSQKGLRQNQKKVFSSRKFHGKAGQIHISETIAVIFIFFVLILFGAIFYYNFQQASFKEKQQELLAARAIDTTTKMLFLPEISCTKGESEPEPNCFDMMKVRHLAALLKEFNQTYYQLFSSARITLYQTYPEAVEVLVYDQEPEQWTSKKPTFFVVALKDEQKGSKYYGYGHVVVEVYS